MLFDLCNFNQFRLISLCNFFYKIISKILVNRIRPLLSKIIDPAQVAFVPNRWITENIVLALEVIHSFKHMKRKKGCLGIKLDFHKAYDRMEWKFIEQVLKALGFDQKFTSLVLQCITTVNYTMLLNGSKGSSFTPSRGLRQGDPLSPYLFILANKVLSSMINRVVAQGNISGAKISNTTPRISKLLYADDVLVFCGAKMSELNVLMQCLNTYCT